MFVIYKQYKNGGKVLIHSEVNRRLSDFKALISIANTFAKEGKMVKLTPCIHFKSDEYKEIYGVLIGTAYERKCPDLQIEGIFYEFENYTPPFRKIKISHMLNCGFKQSSCIIINNSRGASDRYVKRLINERINNVYFIYDIKEVWLYEKGKVRLLFKKQ